MPPKMIDLLRRSVAPALFFAHLLLFLSYLAEACYHPHSSVTKFISVAGSQLFLVSLWTAAGREPAVVRLPSGIAIAALVCLPIVVLPRRLLGGLPGLSIPTLIAVWFVLVSGCFLVRMRHRVLQPPYKSTRFSLAAGMLCLVTTAAVLFATFRHAEALIEPSDMKDWQAGVVRGLAVGGGALFVTFIAAFLLLAPRSAERIYAFAPVWVSALLVIFGGWYWCLGPTAGGSLSRLLLFVGWPGLALATLLVLGAAGWRLTLHIHEADEDLVSSAPLKPTRWPRGVHFAACATAVSTAAVLWSTGKLDHLALRRLNAHSSAYGDVNTITHAVGDDTMLADIPRSTELSWLQAQGGFSARGIRQLHRHNKLGRLDLSGSAIAEDAWKEMRQLTSVRYLNLAQTNIRDAHLSNLASMVELQSLDLDATKITDEGLATIGKMQSLEMLGVEQNPISDAGLREILRLKEIRVLRLHGTNITHDGLRQLNGMNLLRLTIPSSLMDDEGLKLYLQAIQLPDELVLTGSWRLTDHGLQHLPLETVELNLEGGGITDAGIPALAKLTRLQSLRLTNTTVRGRTLNRLSSLPHLRLLSLSGCPVDDDALKPIGELSQVQRLTIVRSGISVVGLKKLRESMPGTTIID